MATKVGRNSYPFVNPSMTGTTTYPTTSSTSGAEFYAYKTSCSATSGSSYCARFSHKITGAAGSGAGIIGYAYAYGVTALNVYGGEFIGEVHSPTSDISTSGIIAGVRSCIILGLDTTGYTYSGQFEFNVASGKTASTTKSAFLGVWNSGAGTGTINLINIKATIATDTPDSNLVSTHADHASTHLIRILVNDSPMWLLACNAHT